MRFVESSRHRLIFFPLVMLWLGGLFLFARPSPADETPTAEQVMFFEKKIRPVLVQHCYKCHSADAKDAGELKGGLLLDSRQGARAGGDTGPAVTPHKLDESLLIDSVRYSEDSYQMPPDGKLSASIITDFEKWVSMGAPDPRDGASATARDEIDWKKARQFWSFQPPARHEPPQVKNLSWPKKPIDAFVLARIEDARLTVAPHADRRTLLRRACFDLCGLPPTLEQQESFLNDDSPDAYAKLINGLLDSRQHGERWGRYWLDVARYAEDNTNMGPHNGPYQHAWRYRDWVVNALNDDLPYDQFIIRQLATDFLPETGPEDHAALGFQGLAPSYHKEVALAQVVLENRYADEWEDRVDAIGRGLLGLTLACARCHDHKYDPVTVDDYYALAGVFASCRQTTRPVISKDEIAETQPARDRVAMLEKELAELDKLAKELPRKIAELEKKLKGGAKDGAKGAASDAEQARQEITEAKQQIEDEKKKIAKIKAEIARLKKAPGFEIPVANALTEEQVRVEEISKARMKIAYYPNKPRDLNIFVRGDAGRLGPLVRRRFLQVFSGRGEPQDDHGNFTNGSGRLELARAIASRENPLTARVIVNRVWMHHFGVGLVDTPSNFGVSGSEPTHPELLDDLTVRFMDNGWSLKWLHREIMLSATYQQSSQSNNPPSRQADDADNRLLSHFSRVRLDAEAFRDSILAVSAKLKRSLGGPSGDADDPNFHRRAIYAAVSRHKLSDTLQTFDFPDPAIHCSNRAKTTTPLQQMFVLNSPFMRQQSRELAERIGRDGGTSLDDRVRYTHQLLFGRKPTNAELDIARTVLPTNKSDILQPNSTKEAVAEYEPPVFDGARMRAIVQGLGATYSVEMWIRNSLPNNSRPVTGYFFSRGTEQPASDHGDHFGISGTHKNAPGRLLFYVGSPHRQSLTGKTTLAVNAWHHVALVRDGEQVTVYLNGNQEPEVRGTAKQGTGTRVEQVFVGGRRDNFANFNGQIQEAAIYDRALLAAEFSDHFSASKLPDKRHTHTSYAKAVAKSRPLAYWALLTDSPASSRANDASGNENHGQYESRTKDDEPISAWQRYAHALLSSNEFMYVD